MVTKTGKISGPLMPLRNWLVIFVVSLGIIGALYLGWAAWQSQVLVPIPVRDLPPYSQIRQTDLMTWRYAKRQLTSNMLRESNDIVGHYTLDPVPKYSPISKQQLGPRVDTVLISNTVALAIEGGPALALGGQFKAGSLVTVWDGGDLILDQVLVLHIKEVAAHKSPENKPHYVIILAIPIDQQSEVLSSAAEERISLTLPLQSP